MRRGLGHYDRLVVLLAPMLCPSCGLFTYLNRFEVRDASHAGQVRCENCGSLHAWSRPANIIYMPDGDVEEPRVVEDPHGRLFRPEWFPPVP